MTGSDLDQLRTWIGTEDEATETITSDLVARFAATFDGVLAATDHAPLGIHWCLAPPVAPTGALGEDGHPQRGGFLPPVALPRRMWAGGELTLLLPIERDDRVTRRSRIVDIAYKSGRSGELIFVTVEHELATARGTAIRERQDIVYREAFTRQAAPTPAATPKPADASEIMSADSVLLFRYSALTFNGHRIHYDRAYATGVEHYSGLVVQGPLQATCLINFAARHSSGRHPNKITYRGLSPLIEGRPFTLNLCRLGTGFELWTADADGRTAMTMTVEFDSK